MPEPLHVAHCAWSGAIGGAERALHLLVREQARDSGLAPAVVYAHGGPYAERTRELGVPVLVLGGTSPRRLGRAARFLRGYDVHHFHGAEPLLMAPSLLCRRARRVYTQRGGVNPDVPPVKRLRYAIVGLMLRHAFHAWSGNTAHGARAGAQLFGLDPEQVATTYNGLEFDLLEPQRPLDEVRRELGLDAADWVAGTAATLKDWKRVERLIEALASADAGDGGRGLIVGDGPERERLEALARDLGVAGRVVFAGKRAHVGDYLQAMDAFALPSNDRESFGNAAVEAMAMGLPVVVFEDCGGMREHVRDGETGIMVSDQAGFAAALRRLREDAALAARIGRAGRDFVRATYTPEAAAARYRALYAHALRG